MKQPEKHMQKPWRPGLICITNGCDKGPVLLSQIEYIKIQTALAGMTGAVFAVKKYKCSG